VSDVRTGTYVNVATPTTTTVSVMQHPEAVAYLLNLKHFYGSIINPLGIPLAVVSVGDGLTKGAITEGAGELLIPGAMEATMVVGTITVTQAGFISGSYDSVLENYIQQPQSAQRGLIDVTTIITDANGGYPVHITMENFYNINGGLVGTVTY
jgi:hypothetical protein